MKPAPVSAVKFPTAGMQRTPLIPPDFRTEISGGIRSDCTTIFVAKHNVRCKLHRTHCLPYLNKQAIVNCPLQKKRSPERLAAAFCNVPKIFCGFPISPNSFIRRELAICCKNWHRLCLFPAGT